MIFSTAFDGEEKKGRKWKRIQIQEEKVSSESSYIHWLLLCVLNIHTSSLTVRGALWMISL